MKNQRQFTQCITASRRLRLAFRAAVVIGTLGTLAVLSFVFLPADSRARREKSAPRLVADVVKDLSPLKGLKIEIPGVRVRRLDQFAVVTFAYDVFDTQQNLCPAAKDKLNRLALRLHELRSQIAVEVAGYAPDAESSGGYATGLLRAARIADCLVSVAGLPPSAIAVRSLADSEAHTGTDRPHAVVITISTSEDAAPQLTGTPIACL